MGKSMEWWEWPDKGGESQRWLERARDCWRGQEDIREPGSIIDIQGGFESQRVLKRSREYYSGPVKVRKGEIVLEKANECWKRLRRNRIVNSTSKLAEKCINRTYAYIKITICIPRFLIHLTAIWKMD